MLQQAGSQTMLDRMLTFLLIDVISIDEVNCDDDKI